MMFEEMVREAAVIACQHRKRIHLKLVEDANATREQRLICAQACCCLVAGTHIELVGYCSLQSIHLFVHASFYGCIHEISK